MERGESQPSGMGQIGLSFGVLAPKPEEDLTEGEESESSEPPFEDQGECQGPSSSPSRNESHPPTPEELFPEYGPRVYRLARRMVNSEDDAEDVVQEVLLQVLRQLPTFRGESAFPTWLHRITVNAALSHRRKQAVRQEHRINDSLDLLLEEDRQALAQHRTLQPESYLESQETRRLIETAIAGLPPSYREVIVLSDIEGLSNAAIGEKLNLSLAAVKSRLHRARLLLRDDLSPYFEDCLA